MNKPQLAFHQGSGFISNAIRWQTRGEYSHVSIILPDGRMVEAREFKGVRILPEFTLADGDRFADIFDIKGELPYLAEANEWLLDQVGKGYDYSSVLRFVSRRQARRQASELWFCSEVGYAYIKKAGLDLFRATEPWEVSPSFCGRSPLLSFSQRIEKDTRPKATDEYCGLPKTNKHEHTRR